MPDLEAIVADAPPWYGPLESAIFGTTSRIEIGRRLRDFIAEHLGDVESAIFYSVGVGLVLGAERSDGSRIVLKVHRHTRSNPRLCAVHRVQRHLAADGLPAPMPVLEPTHLGDGIATAEEYRPGKAADGHDPAVRTSIARGLAAVIRSAAAVEGVDDLGAATAVLGVHDDLWGEPHDLRFDFAGTAAGAEWIDDLARSARQRLAVPAPHVTGHLDWRVENLGFDGSDDVVAIYDFDSLTRAPEPVVVGQAAAGFSTDWRVGASTMPSIQEMAAFVDAYEQARGTPFDRDERELLDAANLYLCAYGARCQHSDEVRLGIPTDASGGWIGLLRDRGERALVDHA
jgi:hypothetical protein